MTAPEPINGLTAEQTQLLIELAVHAHHSNRWEPTIDAWWCAAIELLKDLIDWAQTTVYANKTAFLNSYLETANVDREQMLSLARHLAGLPAAKVLHVATMTGNRARRFARELTA